MAKKREDYLKLNREELLDIYKNLNQWEWDERLGKKPFMFDWLCRYKKPVNIKYRLHLLFCAVWPFTKESYVGPAMKKIRDFLKTEEGTC